MTSKLKCPFCEYELQENRTTNLCCPICGLVAPTKLWQALIQSQQDLEESQQATLENAQTVLEIHKDLEIATKALKKYADEDMWATCSVWEVDYIQGLFLEHGYKIAKEALEQINRKQD